MNLFWGMGNFISDTEFNIKHKMTCRICFLYRFGWVVAFWGGVHIRFFGNGHLWFRPDGDSLFLQAPKKSKQKNACPERTAPRQGSGFLRSGIHPGALPSGRLRATYMQ
ncbi:hypothetical protein ACPCYX_14890 [Pseudomonas fluorescens]|uniref:hypothetical protein n=1 Tax=Pseudomonas fluorescens TaxID=294 RepID=UPI003C16605E